MDPASVPLTWSTALSTWHWDSSRAGVVDGRRGQAGVLRRANGIACCCCSTKLVAAVRNVDHRPKAMQAIYAFIGEPAFAHDFGRVDYDVTEFDQRAGTPGLHSVRSGQGRTARHVAAAGSVQRLSATPSRATRARFRTVCGSCEFTPAPRKRKASHGGLESLRAARLGVSPVVGQSPAVSFRRLALTANDLALALGEC